MEISVGESLANFQLFPSVSGTDITLTKGKKKRAQWGNPLQNFDWYQKKDIKKGKTFQWGNPLQIFGCYQEKEKKEKRAQ